jgi:hypothetical protein
VIEIIRGRVKQRHFCGVGMRIDGKSGALLLERDCIGDCFELWRRKPVAQQLQRLHRRFAVVLANRPCRIVFHVNSHVGVAVHAGAKA